MKKVIGAIVLIAGVCLFFAIAGSDEKIAKSGEELFKQFCAECHSDGGNIINSAKTLRKKDRDANNVRTPEDIIKKMRNPGPGMKKFDKDTISDKDAREIAKYILKTF